MFWLLLILVNWCWKLGSCTTAPTCKRVSRFCFSDEHLWPALSHFPHRSSLSSSTSTTTKTIITKVVEETIWGQSRVCLPGVGVGSPPFFTFLHAGRVHTSTWRSLLTFTSHQFPASQENHRRSKDGGFVRGSIFLAYAGETLLLCLQVFCVPLQQIKRNKTQKVSEINVCAHKLPRYSNKTSLFSNINQRQ